MHVGRYECHCSASHLNWVLRVGKFNVILGSNRHSPEWKGNLYNRRYIRPDGKTQRVGMAAADAKAKRIQYERPA